MVVIKKCKRKRERERERKVEVPEGLIMCAKTYEAFYDLQVQLHAGQFCREYMVLAHGRLPMFVVQIQSQLVSSRGPSLCGGRGKWSCTNLQCLAHMHAKASYGESFSQLWLQIVSRQRLSGTM